MANKDCKYYPGKPSQCTEGRCEIRKSLTPGTKYCPIYFCKLAPVKAASTNSPKPPVVDPPSPAGPIPTPRPPRSSTIPKPTVGIEKYLEYEKEIRDFVNSQSSSLGIADVLYERRFPSLDSEFDYYLGEYKKFIKAATMFAESVCSKLNAVQTSFTEDNIVLQKQEIDIQGTKSPEQLKEEEALEKEFQRQAAALKAISVNRIGLDALKKEFDSQKEAIAHKYQSTRMDSLIRISTLRQDIAHCIERMQNDASDKIRLVYEKNAEYFERYFNKHYSSCSPSSELWQSVEGTSATMPSYVSIGSVEHVFSLLSKNLVLREHCFAEFLNAKNIIVRYNNRTKPSALGLVNSIAGRLMASAIPGKVVISTVDSDGLDGTSDEFMSLERKLYGVLSRSEDVRKCFDNTDRTIADIIQHSLLRGVKTLKEYNEGRENPEPYQLLILEDFPVGLNGETSILLQKILQNGVRAGINVIIMVNEDKIDKTEDTRKVYNIVNVNALEKECSVINLAESTSRVFTPDCLTSETLKRIVHYVNSGVEELGPEPMLFKDNDIPESEWWSKKSANAIEIPFGKSKDRQEQSLRISQESGQNSAVVIGIPGSGKSVFLHTIICNAAIHYSPEELNLYLLDFSGVEFNAYAKHHLPHARVIAPEAEREFGLSILDELVEEGSRRMNICRDNDVTDIRDLRKKRPDIIMPRLLVIIDEFQKLFEVDNDQISKRATAQIHIIIQEFRKFGINLILATQRLPSSSVLPKDLIANRVVFKSSPADFSALISGNPPQLHTGECIYNAESGSPYASVLAQGYLITKEDIDNTLEKLSVYAKSHSEVKRPEKAIVFRTNELPDFNGRKQEGDGSTAKNPSRIGIYFGESISISDTDVHVNLRKESSNNVLIIGGELPVAEKIAYYALCSATAAYSNGAASFRILNFLDTEEEVYRPLVDNFSALNGLFDVYIASKQDDVLAELAAIKDEISARREDEGREQSHIFLSVFAFQRARIFDRGGRSGSTVSEAGAMMDFILKNGPAVGVFTILQCDNLDNLKRLDSGLQPFAYRAALQMPESDSNKIVDSSIASKIFVFNRPSSINRAYLRDNLKNTIVKFKPYKL